MTVERGYLDLLLAQSAERTCQLAIGCELLQKARTELARIWDENRFEPYQQTALRSIDECLNNARLPVRNYRHTVRREFASFLRNLLARTQSALKEDAKLEREHKRKQIAETIEDMGEGLTIVLESLESLLSQNARSRSNFCCRKARSGSAQSLIFNFQILLAGSTYADPLLSS